MRDHLRVLVVEDETLIRWALAETLAQGGCTVVEASDAAAAGRELAAASEPFDVVLLDLRLPDSSDLGLLATVRRLTPSSAVVLMTAYGTPEVMKGALEMGAHRVVSKPFDVHGIESVVHEAHRSRSGRA
jgi:DNA-binding NtrC family response regulator